MLQLTWRLKQVHLFSGDLSLAQVVNELIICGVGFVLLQQNCLELRAYFTKLSQHKSLYFSGIRLNNDGCFDFFSSIFIACLYGDLNGFLVNCSWLLDQPIKQ